LKDIIANHIENKITNYEKIINRIKEKYNMNFEELTSKLKNNADYEQEEDWMDMKGAIVMKEAWEKARKDLIKEEHHV